MPNRKPIGFHTHLMFNKLDKNTHLSSCLDSFQISTNIDTNSLANRVIKKSNVLKFDITIKCKNMFTFQPNRYYCMIELRDPTSGTMLLTQEGNSLLSKETICGLTKSTETEFVAQLKVAINKGNRGTRGVFRIQLLDRDDSSNSVEWTTTESFLIQDRNSKKSTNSKEDKKRKCIDSDSEQHSDTCKSSSEEEETIYAILKSIHPHVKKEEQTVVSKKMKRVHIVKNEFDGVENVHPNIVANANPVACNNTPFDYKCLQPNIETCCSSIERSSNSNDTSSNIDDISHLLFDFNNTLESTPEEGFGQDLWCSDSLSSFFNNFD